MAKKPNYSFEKRAKEAAKSKKKEEKKSAEPAVKRGPGRPRKNEDLKEEKLMSAAKDPMLRALLGQRPLVTEDQQDFREAGVVKRK